MAKYLLSLIVFILCFSSASYSSWDSGDWDAGFSVIESEYNLIFSWELPISGDPDHGYSLYIREDTDWRFSYRGEERQLRIPSKAEGTQYTAFVIAYTSISPEITRVHSIPFNYLSWTIMSFGIASLDSVQIPPETGDWFVSVGWGAETPRVADEAILQYRLSPTVDWSEISPFSPSSSVISRNDTLTIQTNELDDGEPIYFRFLATEGDITRNSSAQSEWNVAPPPTPPSIDVFAIAAPDSQLSGSYLAGAQFSVTITDEADTVRYHIRTRVGGTWDEAFPGTPTTGTQLSEISPPGPPWEITDTRITGYTTDALQQGEDQIEISATPGRFHNSEWLWGETETDFLVWSREPPAPPPEIPTIVTHFVLSDSLESNIRLIHQAETNALADTAQYRWAYHDGTSWLAPSDIFGVDTTDPFSFEYAWVTVTGLAVDASVDTLGVEFSVGMEHEESYLWGNWDLITIPWEREPPSADIWLNTATISMVGSPDTLRVAAHGQANPDSDFWFELSIKCNESWEPHISIQTDGEVGDFTAIWDVDEMSNLATCDSVNVALYRMPFPGGEAIMDTTMFVPGYEPPMEAPIGLNVVFYPGAPEPVPRGLVAIWQEDICIDSPTDGFHITWEEPYGGLPDGWGYSLLFSGNPDFPSPFHLGDFCGESIAYEFDDCFMCSPGDTVYYRLWLVSDCDDTAIQETHITIPAYCPGEPEELGIPQGLSVVFYPGDAPTPPSLWIHTADVFTVGALDTLRVIVEGHASETTGFWFTLDIKCEDAWQEYGTISSNGEFEQVTAVWDIDELQNLAVCDSVRTTIHRMPYLTGEAVEDTVMGTPYTE